MPDVLVERRADVIVRLMQTALAAPDVPSAVTPMLDLFVARTAAVGAAYFESGGAVHLARAASGAMPTGQAMDAILAHGLPSNAPLLRTLEASPRPLFFDDTAVDPRAAGFPDLGVASLAAAPVHDAGSRLLGVFLMHTFAPHRWSDDEEDLFVVVSGALAGLAARLVAEERAVAAQEGALRALGLALEYRDGDTGGHTDRVTALAVRIGADLNLAPDDQLALRWGAFLHDIGKMGVPDAVLRKPGPLDDAEWALMRRHATLGHDFASHLAFLPDGVRAVIRHHHERWAGGGYPDGLIGDAIPLPARVFAVCDTYDALTSIRPYKPAVPHQDAVREIARCAGTQFDPRVVAALLRVVGEGARHPMDDEPNPRGSFHA